MSDTVAETPTAPAEPAAPAAPPAKTEEKKPEADRLAELEAQTKRAAFEGMQRAKEFKRQREELAKEREAIAKEKAEVESFRKEREDRKRNPRKYFQQEFGESWRDVLAKIAMTDEPTVGMVASEIDEKVSAAQREMQDKLAALEQQIAERDARAAAQAKAEYEAGARAYVKANAEKYPLIHAFEVQDNIPAVIEHHFNNTTRLGEDGEMVPGEVLTAEQAADMMEKHLAEKLSAHEKAKAAKAQANEAAAAAAQTKRTDIPQRRSLTTDIGGTSRADRPPPMTEADRMRRALAAIDALGSQPN